jgi:hypothetical protein
MNGPIIMGNLSGARIAFHGIKNAQKNAEIQTVFVFITDGATRIGSAPEGSGGHN